MGSILNGFYRLSVASLLLSGLACTGSTGTTFPSTGTLPFSSAGNTTQTEVLSASPEPFCVQVGQPSTTTHWAMLDALNAYRINNGLNPLVYSRRLEAVIDAHVRDLWARKFFDHINPSGEGPGDRALRADFCHEYVGENIAAGQISVEAVMDAWKKSPGHNANMLEPAYSYVGMGFFTDPTGRCYWGQLLAIELP